MNLTNDELYDLRTYVASADTSESKELEQRITEAIGDEKEYYDAGPFLTRIIEQLGSDDLWRLVRLGQAIIHGEDTPNKTISREFPRYEISQKKGADICLRVEKRVGADEYYYGEEDALNMLLQYSFLNVKAE